MNNNNMEHFIERYGQSWAGLEFMDDFASGENIVKLSSLKKGQAFSSPFRSDISFKLEDGNLYFNLLGYAKYPHTIEHEDPDALVTFIPYKSWDFEHGEIRYHHT